MYPLSTRHPSLSIPVFFFHGYGNPRDLHSFPTRRSSDLHDVKKWRYAPGEASLPRRAPSIRASLRAADEAGGRNDGLDRNEILAGLLVDRDRDQVRVARRIDREVADDAVGDRDAEDRLIRLRAVAAAC